MSCSLSRPRSTSSSRRSTAHASEVFRVSLPWSSFGGPGHRREQLVPLDMRAGNGTRPRERLVRDFQPRDIEHLQQAPIGQLPGPALAADLVAKKPDLALVDAVIVRLGFSRASLVGEIHQPPARDRGAQSFIYFLAYVRESAHQAWTRIGGSGSTRPCGEPYRFAAARTARKSCTRAGSWRLGWRR